MDLLTANDTPGEYPPSLYAASANAPLSAPALDTDLKADVCIIGGGYTGLSTALHLAGSGLSVALLEANRVGWGASGRNGGQVGPGQRVDQEALEKLVGADDAMKLWHLAREATNLVRSLIDQHHIACDYRPGTLYTCIRPRDVAPYRAHAEHLRTRYAHDAIRFVPRDELRDMLGTELYQAGLLDQTGGHLHPLNYAIGLAHAARATGATILENTRVTKVEPGKVTTAQGTITADHIVLACNGYLGDLAPGIAARVMPINNFIIATEPLGEETARSLIRDNVAVADSKFVVNYYRRSPDHRLIFGGGESYSYRFPRDISGLVRRNMARVYPQLKDTAITHSWGGTLAITMNRMPVFARPAPGILSASGYSGHGLAIATLAGKIIAETLTGHPDRFETFARIPHRPFPGGPSLRTPLLTLAMLWYQLRDRL